MAITNPKYNYKPNQLRLSSPDALQILEHIVGRVGEEKRMLSPKPDLEPYWHHLVRVHQKLIELGEKDEDLLLAALLHDSVEDGH
ncbi:MAG: hypothetical protein ACOCXP_02305 [Candidatus Dojkabacteria bacterium]